MCRSLQPGRSPKVDTTSPAGLPCSAHCSGVQLPLPANNVHALRN
ncbi:hypothetical protein NMB32_01345 [Stenotrophomonas sp. CD2]|nr:hypothetical protein NMB32_01345 [Stenotrophomonas sp. CD2]